MLAKDSSETHNNFTEFFKLMADLSTDILENDDDRQINFFTDLYLYKLLSTRDMIRHNKSLKKGGGSYNTNYFSHIVMKIEKTVEFYVQLYIIKYIKIYIVKK